MEEEIYILMERYLSDELTGEEKKAFEQRLKEDSDLAEKYSIYSSAYKNLEMKFKQGDEEEALRRTLTQVSNEELISYRTDGKKRIKPFYWAVAASILLAFTIKLLIDANSIAVYEDYAHHAPFEATERGANEGALVAAQDAFNIGKYDEALSQFNIVLENDPESQEVKLYKGICLLELDKFQEAEALFEDIRKKDKILQHEATWYLALTALKQKNYEKCKAYLEKIPADDPGFEKANKLLKDL